MLRQKAVCLACAGAGLLTLLGMGVSAAAGPQGSGQDLAAVKAEMIRLANAERAKANLAPLVEDARLSRAAQKHTDLMAEKGRLDHDLGGTSPGDRVRAEGYRLRATGEIIFRPLQPEKANAARAVQDWMGSEGHREMILLPRFTEVGVGVRYNSIGQPYYTMVFAEPR